MRADMHEVVIERPRGGPRVKSRRRRFDWRVDDAEAFPGREAIGPLPKTKWLSDLLGPLRRFLLSRVGRSWDDVYGEMRAVLAPDSVLHQHILQHVHRMVTVHVEWRDGVLVDRTRAYLANVPLRIHGFYVCPESGRLLHAGGRWDHARDQDGYVNPRRFLSRRIGQRWEDVHATYLAATDGFRWHRGLSAVVVERAVLIRRGVRWHAYYARSTGEPLYRLPRGRFFVTDGILRQVGAGPLGAGRGDASG